MSVSYVKISKKIMILMHGLQSRQKYIADITRYDTK